MYDRCLEEIQIVDGRYEVRFPFKEDSPFIEDNYKLALARLTRLKTNLMKDPMMFQQYDDIIQNYLKLGILEKACNEPEVGKITYLPHRCVVRDNKKTSKMRIVFDASAKNKGPSLNDCLH